MAGRPQPSPRPRPVHRRPQRPPPAELVKTPGQIAKMAAEDNCAELVLELLKRLREELCKESGVWTNTRVSPTSSPTSSTGFSAFPQVTGGPVDKSGSPTTAVRDIDTDGNCGRAP